MGVRRNKRVRGWLLLVVVGSTDVGQTRVLSSNDNETETNLGTSYSVFPLLAKCTILGHLYGCGSTSDRVWPSSLGEVVRGEGRVVYRG